jgi:hypothetical protein
MTPFYTPEYGHVAQFYIHEDCQMTVLHP